MLLIHAKNIKKYFGDRLILDIPEIKIHEGDRLGIVGLNGAGKTTLINLLIGKLQPDQGSVDIRCGYNYISQLDTPEKNQIEPGLASRFGVPVDYRDTMSGGEKTRYKLAIALEDESPLLVADEPTSNLDIDGIEELEKVLKVYRGAILLISHDRKLLDSCCSKIIEVEDSGIIIYAGNYSRYLELSEEKRQRLLFEYEQYKRERERLELSMVHVKEKSKSIKNAPRRMGNSEARLHKMGGQSAKKNLDNQVKVIKTRIEHLEKKDKPKDTDSIRIDLTGGTLQSKRLIFGEKISKKLGDKEIFHDAEFRINPGDKLALVGPNGSGKSTLIKMILSDEDGIKKAPNARIGYFSQSFEILDDEKSLLDNIRSTSSHTETYIRTMLGRLQFKRDDVYKKIWMLSGGERVKVSFAKLILSDNNILIMDEPTNYLDIASIEALEDAMVSYEGSLLFATHDRALIERVATGLIVIEDKKLFRFDGSFEDYMKYGKGIEKDVSIETIAVLENRLSQIIGLLSALHDVEEKQRLEQDYFNISKRIRELKNK